MRAICLAILLVCLPSFGYGADVELKSTLLVDSPLFQKERASAEALRRIQVGIYDGYEAELCIDDPSQCESDAFKPYKQVVDGRTKYLLTIQRKTWDGLPAAVKGAAVREIMYKTWGHAKRPYSPLDVSIKGDPLGASPLAHLARNSEVRYLRFADPRSLVGGAGMDAYGPNCWYNAVSAITDGSSAYARAQMLAPATWDRPRFMGPTEFRVHMRNFTAVSQPRFGDIVRYYTEEPLYGGYNSLVFGGEVHAAVYVGKETYLDAQGKPATREIALTKNGRSDLDFLLFQDIRGMDKSYLSPPAAGGAPPPAGTQIKKAYFRVKRGSSLLDPAAVGSASDAHAGYLVDIKNYADRWLCLANHIGPPSGEDKNCYSYPSDWMTLPPDTHGPKSPPGVGQKILKLRIAPRVKPFGPTPLRATARAQTSG